MKFRISQPTLAAALATASRAVSSRPSRPVLANVLVTAKDDTLTLVGFDEVLGIETSVPCHVDEPGTITLPAKLWGDIVSRLPAEDVTIAVDDSTATLTCGAGRYEVRGLLAEDYPILPAVEGKVVALPADVLLTGLRGTLFATSTDESKQVLTGAHLMVDGEVLEFGGTDGHRLAVVQHREEIPLAPMPEVTIPAKALRELERMLGAYTDDAPIAVALDDVQARFAVGPQRLTTRLLEGQYPNYRALLPKQFALTVQAQRRELIAALERVAVLAAQKNDIVKLEIAADSIAVSADATEVGSGCESVAADMSSEEYPGINIAFNVRYLLDGLKAMDTATVYLSCNTPNSPAVLVGGDITYLVMPVTIRGEG